MKALRKKQRAVQGTTDQRRNDRDDEGAMSPSMRQLVLSFGGVDPDRTWDANAYTRRSLFSA